MMVGSHKRNLLSELASEIRDKSEQEATTTGLAFNRVAAAWLGYELDASNFVDGAGDHGIDFWFESDNGFDIFQCKSHDLVSGGELDLRPFDNEGVSDLRRVRSFLMTEGEVGSLNEALKHFRHEWEHAVAARRASKDPEPISVNLYLVILGERLTQPADIEFKQFCEELRKPYTMGNVPVEFRASLYSVDNLIGARWRTDNRDWKDIKGTKRDRVDLHPEKSGEALLTKDSAVFYSRAFDLVRAYQEFGYQIFEPNVRCYITHSKVNAAIRESVLHRATREEFRFLNNGVTVVCQGYDKPSANKPYFRVNKPGVINGLQTVFALHEAYSALNQEDKQHFEESCHVLVRLLQEHSLKDINRLVRATNTQNPMQPRNLVSNNTEQIIFERLFAELGWFYERKQGAWEAFAADPRRWRTLQNKSKANFQVSSSVGRPRVRRVDNELVGQTWLSFIGYCEEAVHSKREIFENEKWYDFIFLHVPKKHGYEFQYKLEEARQDCLNAAPPKELMLVSYLAREFARKVAPTAKENRESALKRLGIDPYSTPKEQVDASLSQDPEFLLGQILNGMSFVFVEYLGFVLFNSLGKDLFSVKHKILQNGSLAVLCTQLDYDTVKNKLLDQKFDPDDLLAVIWWSFRHLLEEMSGGAWLASYRAARNRTRFNHSPETRRRLHQGVTQLHQFTDRTQLTRPWAIGIKPGKGLFGFVRDTLG